MALLPVRMPKWGLSMHEGTLAAWHVAEGATVARGDELCDIETAKITNAFAAPASGTLLRQVAAAGEVVAVGRLIAVLAEAQSDASGLDAMLAREAVAAPPPAAPPRPLHHVPTASGSVACIDTGGAGSPVVLLHGFGGDHASWGPVTDALAATCRVIAPDLPGHGGSTLTIGDGSAHALAAPLAEALAALCPGSVQLVAHSLGAAVGRRLVAGGLPVRATTLLAPSGFGCPVDAEYISGFAVARRKRELRPLMERLFARPERLGRETVSASLAALDDPPRRAALERIAGALATAAAGIPNWPGSGRWQVLWGAQDWVIRLSPDIAASLGTRLHLLPDCGHMPPLEAPEAVTRRILAFQDG